MDPIIERTEIAWFLLPCCQYSRSALVGGSFSSCEFHCVHMISSTDRSCSNMIAEYSSASSTRAPSTDSAHVFPDVAVRTIAVLNSRQLCPFLKTFALEGLSVGGTAILSSPFCMRSEAQCPYCTHLRHLHLDFRSTS